VQNRYAGDVGDFMKLGLLRHLSRSSETGGAGLTVGLNWYLVPDEAHNRDGKHVGYLQRSNAQHASLAACDRDLVVRLSRVVEGERSVRHLERSGALPAQSPTHAELLDPARPAGERYAWHQRALRALTGADVVFTDPDNGVSPSGMAPKRHKYALLGELVDYAHRGQSLVVYQHADRSATVEKQARRRLDELATSLDQLPLAAVIVHRGSCRFFLVTVTEQHYTAMLAALDAFASRWASHVELIIPDPPPGRAPAPPSAHR
jgi:hypothetical protein